MSLAQSDFQRVHFMRPLRPTPIIDLSNFSQIALAEAHKVILGQSALFHFDETGNLAYDFRHDTSDWRQEIETSLRNGNQPAEHIEIAAAATSLVINCLGTIKTPNDIQSSFQLVVTSKNSIWSRDEIGYSLDIGEEWDDWSDEEADIELEKSVSFLETGLNNFKNTQNDDQANDTLQACLSLSRDIERYPNSLSLMRLHNSHPQAVNFMMAAHEAYYLLDSCKEEETINNPYFFLIAAGRNLPEKLMPLSNPKI